MSIREHGGAVRFWRQDKRRAVLCADGTILVMINGRWRERDLRTDTMREQGWETDTRPSASAAITRTTREAWRRGSE